MRLLNFESSDTLFWILTGILIVFIFIVVLVYFIQWLDFFTQELKHLNNEIGRTTGREQKHWKKRKKRLLLSIIPFIRYWYTLDPCCKGNRGCFYMMIIFSIYQIFFRFACSIVPPLLKARRVLWRGAFILCKSVGEHCVLPSANVKFHQYNTSTERCSNLL